MFIRRESVIPESNWCFFILFTFTNMKRITHYMKATQATFSKLQQEFEMLIRYAKFSMFESNKKSLHAVVKLEEIFILSGLGSGLMN